MQNTPLTADGPITRLFRAVGAHDFASAALHVLRLPYGRITDRSRFWLVLEEGRGTCTTIDMTGVPAGAVPIERFLHEEPITIDQIGAYKIEVHRRFLRDWIPRTEAARGRSLGDVWRIREACIAALGAGAYATPTR
jgi:hypothetical protein